MGGPCYFGDDRKIAPDCTDNFQIVRPRFTSHGHEWHSVEQAFQALKFPEGSIGRTKILNTPPGEMESDRDYGNRMWHYGNRRPPKYPDWVMRKDWELEKVKAMYVLNLEKYTSSESFRRDLVDVTNGYRIVGKGSTDSKRYGKEWSFWNENTQMAIRSLIIKQEDLNDVIESVMEMSGEEVENMLMVLSDED